MFTPYYVIYHIFNTISLLCIALKKHFSRSAFFQIRKQQKSGLNIEDIESVRPTNYGLQKIQNGLDFFVTDLSPCKSV